MLFFNTFKLTNANFTSAIINNSDAVIYRVQKTLHRCQRISIWCIVRENFPRIPTITCKASAVR
jgi:hypothetical protein